MDELYNELSNIPDDELYKIADDLGVLDELDEGYIDEGDMYAYAEDEEDVLDKIAAESYIAGAAAAEGFYDSLEKDAEGPSIQSILSAIGARGATIGKGVGHAAKSVYNADLNQALKDYANMMKLKGVIGGIKSYRGSSKANKELIKALSAAEAKKANWFGTRAIRKMKISSLSKKLGKSKASRAAALRPLRNSAIAYGGTLGGLGGLAELVRPKRRRG